MGPLWLTVTHGAFPEWSHDFLKVKDPPLIIHACKLLIVSAKHSSSAHVLTMAIVSLGVGNCRVSYFLNES